ncbi:MAG TPA: hypothetical protein PK066_19815, partial [Saprospiraceae bacterium]|nr:hypothetical protein [Saprospiraceae bacterium]
MRKIKQLGLGMVCIASLMACNQPVNKEEGAATETMTESEWIPLFDGSSLDAWRSYLADTIGSAWKIEDGALTRDVSIKD